MHFKRQKADSLTKKHYFKTATSQKKKSPNKLPCLFHFAHHRVDEEKKSSQIGHSLLFVLTCLLNKHVTVIALLHHAANLNSYIREEQVKEKIRGKGSQPVQKQRVNSTIFPVDQRADITRCVVDINVQSGLAMYLPKGHGVLASTHVMCEGCGKKSVPGCRAGTLSENDVRIVALPFCSHILYTQP